MLTPKVRDGYMPRESPGSHGFDRLGLYSRMQGNLASDARRKTPEIHRDDPYKQAVYPASHAPPLAEDPLQNITP
jgi:hypothetical protein